MEDVIKLAIGIATGMALRDIGMAAYLNLAVKRKVSKIRRAQMENSTILAEMEKQFRGDDGTHPA